MKEQISNHQESIFDSEQFWEEIHAEFPGTNVVHKEYLRSNHVHALFTLCPLYAPGKLQESQLIQFPDGIEDSRVSGKWQAIRAVTSTLKQKLETRNGSLHVSIVFANKGVLLNSESSHQDQLLEYHESLYRQSANEYFSELDIAYTFRSFEDLQVVFPQFVDPKLPIPMSLQGEENIDPRHMIEELNTYLSMNGSMGRVSVENKKSRQVIGNITKAFGVNTAFWLIAGYLAFDYQIPSLVGTNGMYLSTERFQPLFRIAHLTQGLQTIPRIEIPA